MAQSLDHTIAQPRGLGVGTFGHQFGRHVLTGVALGVGIDFWFMLRQFAEGWFGKLPAGPSSVSLPALLGARGTLGHLLNIIPEYLVFALAVFFLFFLLRLLLRKDWLAAAAFVLVFVAAEALPGNYPLVDAVFVAGAYGSLIFILKRFGLVPLIVFFISAEALGLPLTTHLSAWYAGPTFIAVVFVGAIAVYGFRVSLAGRPLFSGAALDE